MANMSNLFGGNPFSSQVGQRIEQATDFQKPSEDWTLILEVCDIINENDDGPKDAIRAIRKRLSNQKYPKSILYTLTVTEACVKNCGPRFHKQVATKDFMNDMTKLLGQKGQASSLPQVVQEKVLSLIQVWADSFRNAPELQQIQVTYDSLKQQGFEFPAQDMDNLSPIFTPSRTSDPAPPPPTAQPTTNTRTFAPPAGRPHTAPAQRTQPDSPVHTGPINPTPEQLAKLRSELDIVEGNVRVLNEMLSELKPAQENPDDYELLMELNKTCREMQKRLVNLLDRIANEEVTGVLLRINDDLNNVFIRYDRYERNRKGIQTGGNQAQQPEQPAGEMRTLAADTRTNGDSSLIDFSDFSSTQPSGHDDEFDMFAQSRGTTFADSRAAGSTYEDNTQGVPTDTIAGVMSARGPYPKLPTPPPEDRTTMDDDIEDVEKWLEGTNLAELEANEKAAREEAERMNRPPHPGVQTSETLSSSEFDKFLSERATSGVQRLDSQKETTPARQLTNVISGEHKKTENEMFGL